VILFMDGGERITPLPWGRN
jgi:hypothetical protein